MADAKVEIRVGEISFVGEGPEKWVAEQLDKVLEKVPDLAQLTPSQGEGAEDVGDSNGAKKQQVVTLAKFLEEKSVGKNQTKRFLATAEWLTLKGTTLLKTGDITHALRNAHQPKLNNASQCLNSNVTSGYCEKEGKQFFVTPDGRKSLG